jgi:uncharacterized protein (TIRG00374 family)
MSTAVLERPVAEAALPGVGVLPAPPAVVLRHSAGTPGLRARWPLALSIAMTAAATWWMVGNVDTVRRSTGVLVGLRPGWLLVAAAAAAATWLCSGLSQQGAVAASLPVGRLLGVQFAGTFANQFTPAGLGGGAVNVRFLRRHGSTAGEAVAAVGLTQLAGVAIHMSLLAAVLAVDPSLVASVPLGLAYVPGWALPLVLAALAATLTVVVVLRQRALSRLRGLWAEARSAMSHLRRPRRIAQLTLGSAGLTIAHIAVLYGILRALDAQPPFLAVAAGYLLATTVAALVPSPGGIGGLDACLGMLLYGSGITSPTAVAAVLAYRLLTSWLALVPSAVTLNALVRRGIV